MRGFQSCVLYLMVDSEAPEGLRGRLQSLGGEHELPFANEQAFLDAVRKIQRDSLLNMKESRREETRCR